MGKLRFLRKVNFVLPVLFFITFVLDKAVFYGNVAFSIVVVSSKTRFSSLFKKGLVFQKTCCKAKVIKMFKISSDDMPKHVDLFDGGLF